MLGSHSCSENLRGWKLGYEDICLFHVLMLCAFECSWFECVSIANTKPHSDCVKLCPSYLQTHLINILSASWVGCEFVNQEIWCLQAALDSPPPILWSISFYLQPQKTEKYHLPHVHLLPPDDGPQVELKYCQNGVSGGGGIWPSGMVLHIW
jgi:hypothetical protein